MGIKVNVIKNCQLYDTHFGINLFKMDFYFLISTCLQWYIFKFSVHSDFLKGQPLLIEVKRYKSLELFKVKTLLYISKTII